MWVSLIVPTLDEGPNIPRLLTAIGRALRGIEHEVLVVDDGSSDGTPEVAESLASRVACLRVIRRQVDPGLSASVVDGFRDARGEILAVMDADLQHDPRKLPALVAALETHDVSVGSRYAFQGRTCGWSLVREMESRAAACVTRAALGLTLRDPLSGFFALRREVFERVDGDLRTEGWKILLEILGRSGDLRIAEVPFTFRARRFGKTKMNGRVVAAWLRQLSSLRGARSAHRSAMPRATMKVPALPLEVVA